MRLSIQKKIVTINGYIKNPGNYTLKEKMNIKDLIIESGGVKDNIYRYRIELNRIDPNILNECSFRILYF